MGDTTISWTNKTWNPTRGCSRVSEGCRHCYAETLAGRYSAYGAKPDSPFTGFVTKVNGHASWTGKVELVESMLNLPLTWKKPARIFVNSMSDLFHENLPQSDIEKVWDVMQRAQKYGHTFQILTKRAARMADLLKTCRIPLYNVWLGVSVEDQATADERIPLLLKTPAAKRFVSYEPALGPVDFTELMCDCHTSGMCHGKHGIDWVIVGGESGPGARLFDVEYARNTIAQCKSAGVACFMKQFGAVPVHECDRVQCGGCQRPHQLQLKDKKGADMSEWPEWARVQEYPA